jgi:phasin
MSDNQQDRFEMPRTVQSMAEASFDQARKGLEQFLAGAQRARDSLEERGATMRAGAKDIRARAFACAEHNVQAALDHAQALVGARDVGEVMRLNAEYARTQMRTLAEQAAEMSRMMGQTAIAAARQRPDGGTASG